MDLQNSQTLTNLARSFAAESQAGLRYQIVVDMCNQQGYKSLANEIKHLAKNEVNHAKVFYRFITDNMGSVDNIDIEAGYPFEGTTLEECLKFSMEQEESEANSVYPAFAETARKEGFTDIADKFDLIAKVERAHAAKFKYFYECFKNGTLYKMNEPTMWECSECGHIATGSEAWTVCPLCNSSQGFVELKLP